MLVLVSASIAALSLLTLPVSGFVPRAPIVINGNANFTAANGVTGGTGTPSDPYVIEGWEINATASSHGIAVSSTTSPFVLRNLFVHSGGPFFSAIRMSQVSNGAVENVTVSTSKSGIRVHFGSHILVSDTNASSNIETGIWISGSNLTVARAEASSNARNGIETDGSDIVVSDTTARNNGLNGVLVAISQNVTLSNVTAVANDVGMNIVLSSGVTVAGGRSLDNGMEGIRIDTSDQVVIAQNELARNGMDGILVDQAVGARISDNVFSSNGRYGLFIRYSLAADIRANSFLSDGLLFFGDAVDHYRSHEVTADNTVNGRPISFLKDCSDVEIDGVPIGQLVLANCTRVTVSNLVLAGGDVGVQMAFVDSVVVNQVTIRANQRYGLRFEDAFGVNVEGSLLQGNRIGIGLLYSGKATIRSNVLSGSESGIDLLSSIDILAYQNSFWNNTVHAVDDGSNLWDSGHLVGGNFWSNYSGPDNCSGIRQDVCPDSDGLGDTPLILDSDSRDNYPLMAPPTGPNTPPTADFGISPQDGDVATAFVLDASLSSDSEDLLAALFVRWDWEDDGAWDTSWSTNKVASHTYPAPGTYSIRLEVRDTGGLRNQTTRWVTVSPRPDTSGPQISHTPPPGVQVGQSIPITVVVTDPAGVSTVTLWYRAVGQTDFVAVPMRRASGDLFEAEIPPQPAAGPVEFFITARDTSGNEGRDPTPGTYALEILAGDSEGTASWAPFLIALVLLVLVVTVAAYYFFRKWAGRRGRRKP